MLVIAGSVSAVLLSRGSEVIGDLEGQDVTSSIDTQAECENREINPDAGSPVTGVWAAGPPSTCTWSGDDVYTAGQCSLVGGMYTNNATGADDTCVITNS